MASSIVTISLDDEALAIYQQIPKRERSRAMREMMKNAQALEESQRLIAALRRKIERLEKALLYHGADPRDPFGEGY